MNVHHLELFYYVARHGGISRAVRHMPYGIQQPAISGQMLMLEQDLGKRLFDRNPFKLTPEGEELFAFVKPFFENLTTVAARIRREAEPQLRIAASEIILRDHLPHLLSRLQERHPKLRITLRSAFQAQMEAALENDEIDLAITPLEKKPRPRLHCHPLVRLPLVMLVPKKLKLRSVDELWVDGVGAHPLISLPESETVSRLFQKELRRRRLEWPISLEASSLGLITRYVANGYGVGVGVNAGDVIGHPQVRVLELPGFESVQIAAFWKGRSAPLISEVVTEMERYIAREWPDWRCDGNADGRG